MKRYIMTKSGRARFGERYEEVRRAYFAVTATNEEAAGAGDNCVWHDNFAYEENQRQMHQLARRIRKMEEISAHVEVVSPPKSPQRVMPGCAVTILFEDNEEERRIIIGGFDDSDPVLKRVAYNAPLGQSLVGKEEGDEIVIRLAGQQRKAEVMEITVAHQEEV